MRSSRVCVATGAPVEGPAPGRLVVRGPLQLALPPGGRAAHGLQGPRGLDAARRVEVDRMGTSNKNMLDRPPKPPQKVVDRPPSSFFCTHAPAEPSLRLCVYRMATTSLKMASSPTLPLRLPSTHLPCPLHPQPHKTNQARGRRQPAAVALRKRGAPWTWATQGPQATVRIHMHHTPRSI